MTRSTEAAALALLVLLAGCPASPSTTAPAAPMTPAPPPAPSPPPPAAEPPAPVASGRAPYLMIGVNGGSSTVFRGWPLVVRVSIAHPGLYEQGTKLEPIAVDAAGLKLVCRKGDSIVELGARLAGSLPPPATLVDRTVLEVVFSLESVTLPDGEYAVSATLGGAASEAVTLTVSAEPSPLTEDQDAEKLTLRAEHDLAHGETKEALALADAWLAKHPAGSGAHAVGALALKSELVAAAGQLEEALELCEQAIEAFGSAHPTAEPPHGLLARRRELRQKLARPR